MSLTIIDVARRVADLLFSLPEYQKARNVSVYLAMPKGELSTMSIVRDAFQQGKGVYVPYLHRSASIERGYPKSIMDMVSLASIADYEALEPDAWGIPTPSEASVAERKRCLGAAVNAGGERQPVDLVIMPGMAFDGALARLGHGRGFYDFFLQRYEQIYGDTAKEFKMPFLGKGFHFDILTVQDSD